MYNLCPDCEMPIKALDCVQRDVQVITPYMYSKITKKVIALTQRIEGIDEHNEPVYRCPECGRDICDSHETAVALIMGKKVDTWEYGDIYLDGEFERSEDE